MAIADELSITEVRKEVERAIREIQDRYDIEAEPFRTKLLELQKKCSHPGMPYNPYNGTPIDWTCPDCKASF